jgi:hypothetical protein
MGLHFKNLTIFLTTSPFVPLNSCTQHCASASGRRRSLGAAMNEQGLTLRTRAQHCNGVRYGVVERIGPYGETYGEQQSGKECSNAVVTERKPLADARYHQHQE